MKCFKGFEANPRLQLVTDTIMRASSELFHFLVVFSTIFIGFTMTAHILFGDELPQFSTLGRSTDTAFTTLLGDFDWYTEWSVADKNFTLPRTRILLLVWFWLFEVSVLLILLNMLLAIIMDHYMELVAAVRSMRDAPAIWEQSSEFFTHMREMKGFIPMHNILLDLTDANPAHAPEVVTQKSLLEAFQGMPAKQADFMMKFLMTDAIAKAAEEMDNDATGRLKEISTMVHSAKHEIDMLTMNVSLSSDKLHPMEAKFDALDRRFDSIEANVLQCSSELQEVKGALVASTADAKSLNNGGGGHSGMKVKELSNTVAELKEVIKVWKDRYRGGFSLASS